MYLLDTNVVSELRRPRPHGAVVAWLRGVDEGFLRVSAVTIGELQAGVELTREQDAVKAAEIERCIERINATHNVLPMDGPAFRVCARLMHRHSRHLFEDAMIAATALVHELKVVTRNVRDFEQFGIDTVDPFSLRGGGAP